MSATVPLRRLAGRLFSLAALERLTLLLAAAAFVYELPLSIIVDIFYSFGYVDQGRFIRGRLLLGAALVAAFGASLLLHERRLFTEPTFLVYVAVFSYMSFTVILHREELAYLSNDSEFLASAVQYWTPILFKYLVFFAIGYHLIRLGWLYPVMLLLIVLAAIVVLQHVDYNKLWLDRSRYIDGASAGNYLFLGDAMALSALFVFARIRAQLPKLAFFVSSAAVILLIGSRTSFAVYVGAVLLWLVITLRPRSILPVGALFAAALVAYSTVDLNDIAARNPRILALFGETEDDRSLQGRIYYAEIAWEDIRERPVLGEFGGQREALALHPEPNWRTYAHNVASYWRQFGLPVFLPILWLFYRFVRILVRNFPRRAEPTYALVFLVGVFLVVEMVFSRSFAFSVSHMLFGLVVAAEHGPPGVRIGHARSDERSRSARDTYRRRRRQRRRLYW